MEDFTTLEGCLAAIRKNGLALEHVPMAHRTAEMYHIAVQQNGALLYYVPKELKTPELCLVAVQSNGLALQDVPTSCRHSEQKKRDAQTT